MLEIRPTCSVAKKREDHIFSFSLYPCHTNEDKRVAICRFVCACANVRIFLQRMKHTQRSNFHLKYVPLWDNLLRFFKTRCGGKPVDSTFTHETWGDSTLILSVTQRHHENYSDWNSSKDTPWNIGQRDIRVTSMTFVLSNNIFII